MMNGTLAIRNGTVLHTDGTMRVDDLLVSGGRIAAIGGHAARGKEIDASGLSVLPGLVDLHCHGIRRLTTADGNLAEFAAIEAECGATSFCPTLFGPPDALAEQLRRHRKESDELRAVPQAVGFRLESPYLARTGAGLRRDLAPIGPELTGRLLESSGGHIRIWDISPELPGAREHIASMFARGVVSSIAHTSASIEEARAAVDAGARLVTHLFDVFDLPVMTEPGAYPASLVDYLLLEDRLVCEMILDGTHVHPLLVQKGLRCMGPSRIALITDSNMGAGLPPGRHTLPGDWGRVEIKGSNDGVRLVDRGMVLAGSALTPIDALRNAVGMFGVDLATAVLMGATTPARLLGLNAGEIAVGRNADLILVDRDLRLVWTIVRGGIAWRCA